MTQNGLKLERKWMHYYYYFLSQWNIEDLKRNLKNLKKSFDVLAKIYVDMLTQIKYNTY